jgi:hypothetical protein
MSGRVFVVIFLNKIAARKLWVDKRVYNLLDMIFVNALGLSFTCRYITFLMMLWIPSAPITMSPVK